LQRRLNLPNSEDERTTLKTPTKHILLVAFFLSSLGFQALAQSDEQIYTDSLLNDWQNWSWATTSLSNTGPVRSGSDSISVTCGGGFQALYLHPGAPFDSTPYATLTFWINGGSNGGQPLQVQAQIYNGSLDIAQTAVTLAPLIANTWTQISLSMSSLGVADQANTDGFWIQSVSGSPLPTFYVDDINLVSVPEPSAPGLFLLGGWILLRKVLLADIARKI
jgi:hypothetical protein